MTTVAQLAELCSSKGTVSFGRASQEYLDELGLMLDKLEDLEIYLETQLSRKERADALAEFDSLTDKISMMIEKV
jgi:hypothetical protein